MSARASWTRLADWLKREKGPGITGIDTSRFKFQLMPVYHNGLPMALTDETDYYK